MLVVFSLIQKHLFLLLGIGLGVVLVAHILLRRQSSSVTLAWLLAIVLLPYIGVPLYLILSGRKVRRAAVRKGRLDLSGIELPASEGTGPVRRLLKAYGVPGPCANNAVELISSGEEAYRSLIRLIEEAHTSIYIAIYAFNKDPVAEDIRVRLAEKAMQGGGQCCGRDPAWEPFADLCGFRSPTGEKLCLRIRDRFYRQEQHAHHTGIRLLFLSCGDPDYGPNRHRLF